MNPDCFISFSRMNQGVSYDHDWSISRMGEVAPATSQSYSHLRAQPKHPAIHGMRLPPNFAV